MTFRGTWIRGQDNEGVPMGKKAQITELGLLLVACNDKKSLVDYFVGEGFSLEDLPGARFRSTARLEILHQGSPWQSFR